MFPNRFVYLFMFMLTAALWPDGNLYAQSKTKDKDGKPVKDTVVVYKEEEGKKKPAYLGNLNSNMKEKVIVIRPNDTMPKPTYKDTVIVLKKAMSKEEMAKREEERIKKILKNNNYCTCVKMDIEVGNVLQNETYLNYKFVFKNTCKIDVWVSSKHFRYKPYTSANKPVKVLRKLSFVQRYDYPDFVKIAPDETYTFSYGDDAFFEYDLKKGYTYKFIFEHRNFGDRNKMAPAKTYLCNQKRTQFITIK